MEFNLAELWEGLADAGPDAECLVAGAGGAIRVHAQDNGKVGLVFGSPPLVDALEKILSEAEIA